MPDSKNGDSFPSHPVDNDVRSSSDYQLARTRLSPGSTEVGMSLECPHHCNNTRRQSLGSVRFVLGNEGPDLAQSRQRGQ